MKQTRKILIVEDSPTTRSVVKVYLSGHDFEFIEAPDGEEGLRLAGESRPAAIILDLKLPRMDGFTFCRRARVNAKLRHVPIILLTASKGESLETEAQRAGATHFMTKPIDAEKLAKVLLESIEPKS